MRSRGSMASVPAAGGTAAAVPELGRLAFAHGWRRYQVLVLEAFEDDRRSGRRRTYIVAPPGSGKTLLGMEMIRRLGTRALVLVPNTAVQEQWLHAAGEFGAADGVAAADPSAPIACLTYQALCQLDDPAVALGDVAARRWAAERARATGTPAEEVERDALGWTGEAAARRKRELARITASLKREIARSERAVCSWASCCLAAPGSAPKPCGEAGWERWYLMNAITWPRCGAISCGRRSGSSGTCIWSA